MTQISEQGVEPHDASTTSPRRGVPLILIVTKNGRVSAAAMNYSLNIAERLGYNMLVAYINTLPFLWDGGRRERFLEKAAKDNFREFCELTRTRNTYVASVQEYGKIGKVIRRLCHIVKRVEMVVVDQGVNREEAVSSSPVPVYCVQDGGETLLQKVRSTQKKRGFSAPLHIKNAKRGTVFAATLLGGCVAVLYFFFCSHIEFIMGRCAQGGAYALFPVVTSSVFFLVQNAFIRAVVTGIREHRSPYVHKSAGASCLISQKQKANRRQL